MDTGLLPEGFEVPLHRALTVPLFLGGVPRTFAIFNGTWTAALGLSLQQVWAFPLGIAIHLLAMVAAKHDPQFFECLIRHLKQRTYYEA